MKFCSFNVEGLFDKLQDKEFTQVIQSYDFITLVETWLPTKSKISIEGFYSFSKSRKKNERARRYSGGISILVKQNLKRGLKIIDEKCESFLWVKLCKDFSTFHKIFLFVLFTYHQLIPLGIENLMWIILPP